MRIKYLSIMGNFWNFIEFGSLQNVNVVNCFIAASTARTKQTISPQTRLKLILNQFDRRKKKINLCINSSLWLHICGKWEISYFGGGKGCPHQSQPWPDMRRKSTGNCRRFWLGPGKVFTLLCLFRQIFRLMPWKSVSRRRTVRTKLSWK